MAKDQYISVRKYAEKHKISTQAVRQKIQKNLIKHKKINNITHVLDEDENAVNLAAGNDEITDKFYKRKQEIEIKIREEKLKNLREDTIYKKQRNKQTKEMYRKEFAEGVFQCFTDSFSDVKNVFIEMKLTKEENAKLKNIFAKAIKKFQEKLNKYLQEQDEKQQGEN